MYTTCISINTQFLLFIGKLQGGPNSYPLLVHLVYMKLKIFCALVGGGPLLGELDPPMSWEVNCTEICKNQIIGVIFP